MIDVRYSTHLTEPSAVLLEPPIYGQWIEIWGLKNGQRYCVRRLMGLPYGTTLLTWNDHEVKKVETTFTDKF